MAQMIDSEKTEGDSDVVKEEQNILVRFDFIDVIDLIDVIRLIWLMWLIEWYNW